MIPSAPLVPQSDPTLLFVNAGMVPFKNIFTGAESPPAPRAASSQKCVRAGGKHNDLDNVGYTARHLTFFEMLGNFSFGDYFKEGAIEHAWRLVTREFGLNPERLSVTVYAEDDAAASLWRKIAGLPEERIIRIGTSDNFWSMGDNGPCGPCSEIFYDHGPDVAGGPPGSPDEDGDRFVEIWNLVFMQYEQEAGKIVRDLPKPSIDTGMGLERAATVLQGVHSVFDTDLFRTLIAATESEIGKRAEGDDAGVVPGDRRPPALDLLPDRRRGDAVERGARLCAAPDHAPGHAPRLSAGRVRAADAPPRADPDRRDGRRLSRPAPRRSR